MSILSSISALQDAKTNIATAITEKGGTVNSNDGFADFADAISTIRSGGTYQHKTITQEGTFTPDEGYDAMDEVTVNIAPPPPDPWDMDYTDDKLRFFINLTDPDYLSPVMKVRIGANYHAQNHPTYDATVTIDWGDGVSETITRGNLGTGSGYISHTYPSTGKYIMTVTKYNPYEVFSGTYGGDRVFGSNTTTYSTLDYAALKYCMALERVYEGFAFSATNAGDSIYTSCTNIKRIEFCSSRTDGAINIGSSNPSNGSFLRDRHPEVTSVTLPTGITSINTYAFSRCTKLKSINIPSGVTLIKSYAFASCVRLETINLPDALTTIQGSAFSSCVKLELTSLPSGVTSIGSGAFSNCHLIRLTSLPSGLTTIAANAFQYCKRLALTSLPQSITTIEDNSFYYCDDCMITDYSNITTIGQNNFSTCNVEEMKFGSGLTKIGNGAFAKIPNCLKIDFTACQQVVQKVGTNTFATHHADLKIVVPDALYSDWIAATNWTAISSFIVKESEYSD